MRPLEGYRVVEVGIWVAAPAGASILAEWGADVIKVEAPAGDPNRFTLRHIGVEDESPAFHLDNRGKRSVVLDLKSADDRSALEALLADADVFITNLRPAALERLELDPATVRSRHPRLVVASLTSYGWTGPDRDEPGYDVSAFWARSGIAATLNPADQPPPGIRAGLGDRVAATALVAGIAAALLARERTGRGDVVDVSLLRSGLYCDGSDLSVQLHFGKRARTRHRSQHESPLYNSYRAGDGRWFWLIALEGARHLAGIAAALERADLLTDERFATSRSRRENGNALIQLLDEVFATRTLDEWASAFKAAEVWWAPVLTLAEVVQDPQAEAAGAWVDVDMADGRHVRSVASPVSFWESDTRPQRPAPGLGEHTAEIRAELDLRSATHA